MKNGSGRFIGVLLFLAMFVLFSLAVMFLWNALLPRILGLSVINYWQAAGLLILARILFGGVGGGNFRSLGHRNIFRDKWSGMSETEREAFFRKHGHIFHNFHNMESDTIKNGETKKE
jgi:hypothetical protein